MEALSPLFLNRETMVAMRILYGLNSQGQGHLSKAAVLVPLLQARGHEVRVVSSGPKPPAYYVFPGHRHFPGLQYATTNGVTDYRKTAWEWLRNLPQFGKAIRQVQRIVRKFEPDLILSDFEPYTASPLITPRCEVLSVCRQVAVIDHAIPLPPGADFERKMIKSVIKLFVSGADRRFGYHYAPASYRCLPPIIRDELRNYPRETRDYFLVYAGHQTTEKNPHELIEWSTNRRVPVVAYGFEKRFANTRHGRVEFRSPNREVFLRDLAQCRAVLTTAGMTTPLESFLLGKPVAVVPIENQWEQLVNAFHLQQAGLATWEKTWNYDALLELEPASAAHGLTSWLTTPAERVLDVILSEHASPIPDDHQHGVRRAA